MSTLTETSAPPARPADRFPGLRVVDADTHFTEPHDLWTSRAPRGFEDKVPHVVDVDGEPTWTVDGVALGRASASSVVRRDGERCRGSEFIQWVFDDAHPAAYDVPTRLAVMDEIGIWAQIVYPNVAGFGGQKLSAIADPDARRLSVTLYNDAMVELQETSRGRLFPMALLPSWDVDAAVAEVDRIAQLGLRGVNISSDPQLQGLPDLGDPAWDPLWAACADRSLPVQFHIGASQTSLAWYGTSPWPSMGDDQKLAIGAAMMYLTNARVLANVIYSGLLERHPALRMVSVESGIGWIPFVLESLDHQLNETAPGTMDYLSMMPSEYFRRQMYACFWFEQRDVAATLEQVGVDNVLFETDFPHPTCLYPDGLDHVARSLEGVAPDVARKVLQDNAVGLYRIELPAA
ncbi:MAG TPA: amidohydrolase family protein [Acidimicrobiia bacterium]|nr:amidohydrolase family protein [Acidimicrobiia bacterium]